MDYRLTDRLGQEQQANDAFWLRNAGARVTPELLQTVQALVRENDGIERIVVRGHTDCGATSIVARAIKDGEEYGMHVRESLIDQYRLTEFAGPLDLERQIPQIGAARIREVPEVRERGIEVQSALLETGLLFHAGPKELILAAPSTQDYPSLARTAHVADSFYAIQGNPHNSLDILSDIILAVGYLGVARITAIAYNDRERDSMRRLCELAGQLPAPDNPHAQLLDRLSERPAIVDGDSRCAVAYE